MSKEQQPTPCSESEVIKSLEREIFMLTSFSMGEDITARAIEARSQSMAKAARLQQELNRLKEKCAKESTTDNNEEQTEKEIREKIEHDIWWHSSETLSESMSSRAVEAFLSHQFQAEKLRAILNLSDITGVPISVMQKRTWVEHNVINNLVREGNITLAKEVALDPNGAREKHPELFQTAQKFVSSQRGLMGAQKGE